MVLPALASFFVRSWIFGKDRALEGSTQALSLVPGILGQYVRRAFLGRVLVEYHPTATVEFGTIFSSAAARIEAYVYIGPGCRIGLAHIERDVLLAPGVQIPSGPMVHGIEDLSQPIREQPSRRILVRIGAGTWVGSAAVVMNDVGRDCVIGAGAVVTHSVPEDRKSVV